MAENSDRQSSPKTPRRPRGDLGSVWDVPIGVLLGLGLFAIAVAFAGWMIVLRPDEVGIGRLEEALYRAISVNTLSDIYARPIEGPHVKDDWSGVGIGLLVLARWVGVLVFFLTLAKVVVRLFWQSILTWRARTRFSDHVVIVGDREFARQAAEEAVRAGLEVVHFTPGGQELVRDGILTLDSDIGIDEMLRLSAAHRARSLVFASHDNAESASLARQVFEMDRFGKPAASAGRRPPTAHERVGPHIFVFLDDDWFEHREELNYAFHKHDNPGSAANDGQLDSVVEIISESRCSARAVLGANPLFMLHEGGIQHTLLVGFGAMGEALLTEICETQRVDADRRQQITIIDRDPAGWARFEQRCPHWEKVFDGVFIPRAIESLADDEDIFLDRLRSAPLTAAFVVTGADSNPTMNAARLKQILDFHADEGRLPERDLCFPIFTCERGGSGAAAMAVHRQARKLADAGVMERLSIIPFGAWPEVVAASRVLEEEPDRAAFMIHSVHNSLYSDDDPTNWSCVAEVNRYSSRSAANFVPALVHVAGYDLSAWLAHSAPLPPSVNALPQIEPEHVLAQGASELVYLARLEHARWCAERWLRGFRWDAKKDKARKRHPDLVDFRALPEASQDYNIRYIRALSNRLLPEARGALAPTRSGARRILIRPSDMGRIAHIEQSERRTNTENPVHEQEDMEHA